MPWQYLEAKHLAFLLFSATIFLLASVALAQTETPTSDRGLVGDGSFENNSTMTPNGEPLFIQFTFDEGLEGWATGHMGGEYDSAEWSDDHGNPPGSVRLDGSDLGNPDGQPNSWMTRTVTLAANFDLLTFDTRAEMDGALRVLLVDAGGASHTLLDWEVLEGEEWRERTADIGPYAGQTVTLTFEQGDNDLGIAEHRYVDNVILCQSADPDPTATSANCVQPSVGGNENFLPFFVH